MKKIYSLYKNLYLENKSAFYVATVAFFVFAASGYGLGSLFPGLMDLVVKLFEEKFGNISSFSWPLVWGIFYNNLRASMLVLFGGVVLGIFPIISLMFNGGILGLLVQRVSNISEFSLWQKIQILFLGLVPHGIVELPVLFFTVALGVKLGTSWLKPGVGQTRKQAFVKSLNPALLYVPALVILLFVAAILEVFLTGWLLK